MDAATTRQRRVSPRRRRRPRRRAAWRAPRDAPRLERWKTLGNAALASRTSYLQVSRAILTSPSIASQHPPNFGDAVDTPCWVANERAYGDHARACGRGPTRKGMLRRTTSAKPSHSARHWWRKSARRFRRIAALVYFLSQSCRTRVGARHNRCTACSHSRDDAGLGASILLSRRLEACAA